MLDSNLILTGTSAPGVLTSVGTTLAGVNDLQLGNSLTQTHKTANLAQDLLELLCQLFCNQILSCSITGLDGKV